MISIHLLRFFDKMYELCLDFVTVIEIHVLNDLFTVSTSAALRSFEESQDSLNKQKDPGSEKFR